MSTEKKHYDKVFRRYVAKLAVQDGRRPVDLERELGVSYSSLLRWIKEYKAELRETEKAEQKTLYTATEYKGQVMSLEKANRELQEEVDILKKALHIFTENPEN